MFIKYCIAYSALVLCIYVLFYGVGQYVNYAAMVFGGVGLYPTSLWYFLEQAYTLRRFGIWWSRPIRYVALVFGGVGPYVTSSGYLGELFPYVTSIWYLG